MNEQCDQTVEPAKVEALAGYGLSIADIALILEVDADLLQSRHLTELKRGRAKANARVAESLYRKATSEARESVSAAIFWLKARASWKEVVVNEMTHDVADPIARLMQEIAARGHRIHDPNAPRVRLPSQLLAGGEDTGGGMS